MRPGDCQEYLSKVQQRSVFLSYFAHDKVGIEFCRPTLKMESDEGAIASYYDIINDLNDQGVMEVKKQLLEKIYTGGLIDMYYELMNRM